MDQKDIFGMTSLVCLLLIIMISGCLGSNTTEEFSCGENYYEYKTGDCCRDMNSNQICDRDEGAEETLPETTSTVTTVPETTTSEPTTTIGPACGENYYEYKKGDCCLDMNHNDVCDSDEAVSSTTTSTSTLTSTTFLVTIIPTIPVIYPLTEYCAEHFTKINASEMPMCGEWFMGGSPIIDAYGCRANENYPPESACPEGTEMNNLYGYADGTTPVYLCYVPQETNASEAPPGCPIDEGDVSCYTGFTYSEEESELSWSGSGSSWGCYFTCKADPDPYDTNPNWPCTKEGYKPIGGGGGDTCCAKW